MLIRAASKASSILNSPVRWATKLSGGVTRNQKDSPGNYLGIKKFGGEAVTYNKIIVRQRGFKWRVGANVFVGRDHTLHSAVEGYVLHERKEGRVVVSVVPWKIPEKLKLKPVFSWHPELFPERATNNPPPTNYAVKQKVRPEKVKHKREIGKALAEPKYLEKIEINLKKAEV